MKGNGPACQVQDGTTNGATSTTALDGEMLLTCEQFNCHGFKQSSDFVYSRLQHCDILCLTETWLKPSELPCIQDSLRQYSPALGKTCLVFAKSGMENTETSYAGLPYGGLCVIVKKDARYTARLIESPSDRTVAVGIYNVSGNLIQVIVCVYMPFFNGSADKLEEYVDTCDTIQTLIDKYGASAPLLVAGDFNTQLPNSPRLSKKWFKSKGFNKYSSVLYDLITGNDMLAMDLCFQQSTSYTYFNHANQHFTWIDHILCFKRDFDNVKSCLIVPENDENVSDHLPVTITFTVDAKASNAANPKQPNYDNFATPNWSNQLRNEAYLRMLQEKLADLQELDYQDIESSQMQVCIDERLAVINDAIHEAAKQAGCTPFRRLKPKPFWCPELSVLRDKKRFWWSMWVSAGRPRTGHIFSIWKDLKKQFRKLSRKNVQNIMTKDLRITNQFFAKRQMKSFWNKLKRFQNSKVCSNLTAEDIACYYKTVMTDAGDLTRRQQQICDFVEKCAASNSACQVDVVITASQIMSLVKSLKCDKSPGCDGITPEHLLYGMSSVLANVLANFYSLIISTATVPSVFTSGVIIPILKKPSCDPNTPSNYRPITLSSIHSKIAEMLLMPDVAINDCQYGFREGRGTTFVTSTINDCAAYYIDRQSSLFCCSLDAEKCFDSIWHAGLMYKLWPILPPHHWMFLYRWYKATSAVVRWNGSKSLPFQITKGMRQGSLLSPALFNIFMDEMLDILKATNNGARIFDLTINCCVYADDVNLLASSVKGLQCLIDICVAYAELYRFKFGHKKSKCIIFGKNILSKVPTWKLCQQNISIEDEVEILGVTFDSKLLYNRHVQSRINSCRQRVYGLATVGMTYPGLSSEAKSYIWKSLGAPIMCYGIDSIPLSSSNARKLKSAQGTILKRVMGINNRSHHSRLLEAMCVPQITETIKVNTQALYHRIFKCECPAKELQTRFLADYLRGNKLTKNSLLQQVILTGASPIESVFTKPRRAAFNDFKDGFTDSLQYMILHDNYIKPHSNEHQLVALLLKAF